MFDQKEQKAILKVIDKIIKADDFIDIREAEYLEEIVDTFKFKDGNLLELKKIKYKDALEIVKDLTEDKKDTFINMILGVASSDNDISKTEKKVISDIKKIIYS